MSIKEIGMFRKSGRLTLKLALLAAFAGTALVAAGPAASSSYTITADGTPLTVTTTAAGENVRATFSGAAGQRVSLDITGVAIGTSGCCSMKVWIAKPDGTLLVNQTYVGNAGAFFNTRALPVAGTYRIVLDPQGTAKGSATLKLYTVPADLSIPAVADGSPNVASVGTPGQNAYFPFSGTAGQRVSLEVSDLTMASAKVSILKPDGSNLLSAVSVNSAGAFFDPRTLPVNGTYKVFLNPVTRSTGDATVRVHNVPADVSATITAGGAPQTVSVVSPGQNARLSFSGIAGKRVSLSLSDVTMGSSSCCSSKVSILKPDGSTLTAATLIGTAGGFLDRKALPVSGSYKIVVNPQGAGTGDMTLQLYDVPADASGAIAPGTPLASSLSTPGQNAAYTFTGALSQRISLDVSSVSFAGAKVGIMKPDGSYLVSPATIGSSGGFIDAKVLPVAGVYKVTLDPVSDATGSATLSLYNVPADASGSITIGGASQSLTMSTPGQNGKLTFSAAAAQDLFLDMSSVTCNVKVSILKPDGTKLVYPTQIGTSGGSISKTTTVAGTYTIVVDPVGGETGSITLQLSSV
jgi:large repetitive protein